MGIMQRIIETFYSIVFEDFSNINLYL